MSRSLLTLSAVLCLATAVSAHICMWSPLQRGAISYNDPGDHTCYNKAGPETACGHRTTVQTNPTVYTAGEDVTIQFQQNLNHFTFGNAGYLSAQLAVGTSQPSWADFLTGYTIGQIIPDYNANDEIAVSNFSITGTIPAGVECEQCVLRLIYVSNNPGENDTTPNFVQCADVVVNAPAGAKKHHQQQQNQKHQQQNKNQHTAAGTPVIPPSGAPIIPPQQTDCTSPSQWETLYLRTGGYLPSTGGGSYSYDSVNQYTYQFQSGQTHIANFSSGYEFLYDVTTTPPSCGLYGIDPWNNWMYGSTQDEIFVGIININEADVNLFYNQEADIGRGASVSGCLPVMRWRMNAGQPDHESFELQMYYNTTLGIERESIFIPPQVCLSQLPPSAVMMESKEWTKTLPRLNHVQKNKVQQAKKNHKRGNNNNRHSSHKLSSPPQQQQRHAMRQHHRVEKQIKNALAKAGLLKKRA